MSYPTPEPGSVHEWNGQAYTFEGDPQPHTTRDGRTVEMFAWLVDCLDCAAPFAFRSGHKPNRCFKRRCPPCGKQAQRDAAKRGLAAIKAKQKEKAT